MSSTITSYADRFRALPRAGQWAVIAGVGLVGFLLWEATISQWSQEISKQADTMLSKVAQIRAGAKVTDDLEHMGEVIVGLGPVQTPDTQAEGAAKLNRVVNDVLKRHSVSNQSFDMRIRGKLPPTALTGVTDGKRLDRLVGDLKFTAAPTEALAVIAELESSPEIEAINTVRITKDAAQKVKVNLTVESWVISLDKGTR
jgi:hypothetical protein